MHGGMRRMKNWHTDNTWHGQLEKVNLITKNREER